MCIWTKDVDRDVERFIYLLTGFLDRFRTGVVPSLPCDSARGFSLHEAEASPLPDSRWYAKAIKKRENKKNGYGPWIATVAPCGSSHRFIGLSVFGSRNRAKDHGLRTVQRTAYPTLFCWKIKVGRWGADGSGRGEVIWSEPTLTATLIVTLPVPLPLLNPNPNRNCNPNPNPNSNPNPNVNPK